ncbi:MAG: response regulator transcription factor, partial [Candidatus Dadabacteria bacterium]|nr:response regulator transcription factor [Candidatus Dadabacteria bacterium]
MKARVLIVEDELELAELVQMYLKKDGIESQICADAETAVQLLSSDSFDLLVLDINLPGKDGFELLGEIRPRVSAPVIIISARDADEDIIMGLGAGADEFVTKPFAPRVLVARIRALLRRARAETRHDIQFGPYSIDLEGYYLARDERRVVLSSKEFEVLRHLLRNPGRAMTSDEIYTEVWNNKYGDTTSVAVYIRRIRRKIEEDPHNPLYIQTIH